VTVLPIRPATHHGDKGDAGPQQGIDEPRQQQLGALYPKQAKGTERIQGDEGDGGAVVVAQLREKQGGGECHPRQLQRDGRGKPDQRTTQQDTEEGASNALKDPSAGGGIAALTDNQAGQQYPEPLLNGKEMQQTVSAHQAKRHPQCMPKQRRRRFDLLANLAQIGPRRFGESAMAKLVN